VISKLGRGKYADIFEAIDVQSKKKVAIKVLKPSKIPPKTNINFVKSSKVED